MSNTVVLDARPLSRCERSERVLLECRFAILESGKRSLTGS